MIRLSCLPLELSKIYCVAPFNVLSYKSSSKHRGFNFNHIDGIYVKCPYVIMLRFNVPNIKTVMDSWTTYVKTGVLWGFCYTAGRVEAYAILLFSTFFFRMGMGEQRSQSLWDLLLCLELHYPFSHTNSETKQCCNSTKTCIIPSSFYVGCHAYGNIGNSSLWAVCYLGAEVANSA